jgi:hypothetical protein
LDNVITDYCNRGKEEGEMKRREIAKKGLYIGIGAGLVLFVLAGFMPGSLIGGVIGLRIVNAVTGGPLGSELIPRIVVGVSMLAGIIASALICIMGPGVVGWSIGSLIDSVKVEAEKKEEAAVTGGK